MNMNKKMFGNSMQPIGSGIGGQSMGSLGMGMGNMPMGMGGMMGGTNLAFDPNEFPALGNSTAGGNAFSNNNAFKQHQPPREEFTMSKEDFPALPGAGQKTPSMQSQGGESSQQQQQQQRNNAQGAAPAPSMDDLQAQQMMLMMHYQQLGAAQGGTNPIPAAGPGAKAPPSSERFGLMGLLNVIRMTDPDLNTLALGTDLTSLGLNLNGTEPLYHTFASPFSDTPGRREPPTFTIPRCYFTPPPTLKSGHFSKLHVETLFYIFYSMPRDLLQAAAAQELYERNWRYHKDNKLWFTRGPDPSNGHQMAFFFFDLGAWEKRVAPANEIQNLSDSWERRAPEVKFPNS